MRASNGNQVGDQLRRNRRTRPWLSVLPCIAEIGNHRRDPLGRRALQRVDADQQFHQIVVGRIAGRLDDEHIFAAHILVDFDEHFLVREAADAGVSQRKLQITGNRLCERQVGVAG